MPEVFELARLRLTAGNLLSGDPSLLLFVGGMTFPGGRIGGNVSVDVCTVEVEYPLEDAVFGLGGNGSSMSSPLPMGDSGTSVVATADALT